jgi:hypothetical protein
MRLWIAPFLIMLAASSQAGPLSPSLDGQLAASMARGDNLYAYDQSAWHVTDAAMAALPSDAKALIRGYITTPIRGGLKTTFYGEDGERYYMLYSAVWNGTSIEQARLVPAAKREPVSEEELRLIAARNAAISEAGELTMCSKAPPNSLVIPGSTTEDAVSVYFMTPQTENGTIPMGGHHRLDVQDGMVIARRSFTRSCLDLKYLPDSNGGPSPETLFITHLLDPIPTEIHAFAVHSTKLPLCVITTDEEVFCIGLRAGRAFAERDSLTSAP